MFYPFLKAICDQYAGVSGSQKQLHINFQREIYQHLVRQPAFFSETVEDLVAESRLLAADLVHRCRQPQVRVPFQGAEPIQFIATSSKSGAYWRKYLFSHPQQSMLRDSMRKRMRELRDKSPRMQRKLGIYRHVRQRLADLSRANQIEVVVGAHRQPRWQSLDTAQQPPRVVEEITESLRRIGVSCAPALPPDGRSAPDAQAGWVGWLSRLLVSALSLAGRALTIGEVLGAVEPFFFNTPLQDLHQPLSDRERRVQETMLAVFKDASTLDQALIRCVALQDGFVQLYAHYPELRTASTRSRAIGRANERLLKMLQEELGVQDLAADLGLPQRTAEIIYEVVLRGLEAREKDAPNYLFAPEAAPLWDGDPDTLAALNDYAQARLEGLEPEGLLALLGQQSAARDPLPGFLAAGWPTDHGSSVAPSIETLESSSEISMLWAG